MSSPKKVSPFSNEAKGEHGTCYVDAISELLNNAFYKDYKLAYGYIYTNTALKDKKIHHAWLENENYVFEPYERKRVFRKEAYDKWKPSEVKRFTHADVLKLLAKTGRFGLWTKQEIRNTGVNLK